MSTASSTRISRPLHSTLHPFRALRNEFDHLVNRLASSCDGDWRRVEFNPACDVSETVDAFQISIDVPGTKPDDITVQVTNDSVQISGERKHLKKDDKVRMYHRQECPSGKFSETLQLPSSVNEEKVHAEFHDGVLTITLPKTVATRTHTVRVCPAQRRPGSAC